MNSGGSNRLAWLITGLALSLLANATLGGALMKANGLSEDIRANAEAIKANTQAIGMLSERQGRTEVRVDNCIEDVLRLEDGG